MLAQLEVWECVFGDFGSRVDCYILIKQRADALLQLFVENRLFHKPFSCSYDSDILILRDRQSWLFASFPLLHFLSTLRKHHRSDFHDRDPSIFKPRNRGIPSP